MEIIRNSHQDEEAYFKSICAIGVGCRDKGSALFHNIMFLRAQWKTGYDQIGHPHNTPYLLTYE